MKHRDSAPSVRRSLPPKWPALALGAVALMAIWYTLAHLLPVGADFYPWYYRVPRLWLTGETLLYDEASRQFFSPPWALWLFLPFAGLESNWAMAGFTLVSMGIITSTSYLYGCEQGSARPWLIVVLMALCPYTLVMLFTGTPDAWSLLGIFLGYRAIQRRQQWLLGGALLLALVRPQNAVLTIPAFLVSVRSWSKTELAQVAVVPAIAFVGSAAGFGWDWPLRWWQNYFVLPPSPRWFTSIYTGVELLGLPGWTLLPPALALMAAVLQYVRRKGLTRLGLEAAVAANAILVPYMRSVSFVVLLALPWVGLAARRPRLASAAYAITLPTLAVSVFWERLAVVDITFPIVLLGLLVLEARWPAGVKAAGHG